ncbi:MAG: hypothetical protein ABR880_18850 [Candidatus Sulfotelmatobacter sp.]|jgi:hypothetical protein
MANRATPNPVDQKRWKQLFEGSLTSPNGGTVPASQQPIFRLKTQVLETDSKAALTTAAASLAALWQISPNRPHRSE